MIAVFGSRGCSLIVITIELSVVIVSIIITVTIIIAIRLNCSLVTAGFAMNLHKPCI